MIEQIEALIQALRDELQHYGEMLSLLDQQQDLVVRRAADDLLNLVSAINLRSEVIQAARHKREALQRALATRVSAAPGSNLARLLTSLPEKYRALAGALVHENNELLFRVRQRAHQNHILIRHSMNLMERFINLLVPAGGTSVYNGAGQLFAPVASPSSLYEAVG